MWVAVNSHAVLLCVGIDRKLQLIFLLYLSSISHYSTGTAEESDAQPSPDFSAEVPDASAVATSRDETNSTTFAVPPVAAPIVPAPFRAEPAAASPSVEVPAQAGENEESDAASALLLLLNNSPNGK